MSQTERDLARSAALVRAFRAEHPDGSDEELYAYLYRVGHDDGYWLGNFGNEDFRVRRDGIAEVGFY